MKYLTTKFRSVVGLRLFFRLSFRFFLCVLVSFMAGCGPKAVTKKKGPAGEVQAAKTDNKSLRFMFYNIYNTFDTEHDIDERKKRIGSKNGPIERHKHDTQYLSKDKCIAAHELQLSECKGRKKQRCIEKQRREIEGCKRLKKNINWTEDKYAMKLEGLKRVFDLRKTATKENSYPDIVGLVEIENEKVTRRMADLLGYEHQVTSNSYDFRGIDVALMYRARPDLVKIAHKEYQLDRVEREGTTKGKKHRRPTRPILEVHFEFRGKPLFVYVNHWPSLRNDSNNRVFAAEKLRSIIELQRRKNGKAQFIALGDFNTADRDSPHPFKERLFLGQKGLDPLMVDVTSAAVESGVPVAPGTYYYSNRWQDLDRFFVSHGLLDKKGLDADLSTFSIFNHEAISEICLPRYCYTGETVPKRYNFYVEPGSDKDPGYSDHYPIYLTLRDR